LGTFTGGANVGRDAKQNQQCQLRNSAQNGDNGQGTKAQLLH